MKLVPTEPAEGQHMLPNGSTVPYHDTWFFKILLGGDQLTVARVRGTQTLRDSEDKVVDRLEGVIPVVEDWHARMTLMIVSVYSIIIFYIWYGYKFVLMC